MEDNTLSAYIAYFRELAAMNRELNGSFVHGNAGRIVGGSRSEMVYPCLWLETPGLQLSEKDTSSPVDGLRRGAVVVLLNVPADDYAAQDAGWERAEGLALDVLSRLRRDRKARRFALSLDGAQLEAVTAMSVNNEIGWRFEFGWGAPVNLCYNAAKWLD